ARRRPAPRRLARLRAHRAGPGAPVPRGGLARGRDRGRPLALDGGHAGEGARAARPRRGLRAVDRARRRAAATPRGGGRALRRRRERAAGRRRAVEPAAARDPAAAQRARARLRLPHRAGLRPGSAATGRRRGAARRRAAPRSLGAAAEPRRADGAARLRGRRAPRRRGRRADAEALRRAAGAAVRRGRARDALGRRALRARAGRRARAHVRGPPAAAWAAGAGNVSLLAPLGLLALVALPAVVILHLYRRRLRQRRVAGLFLFRADELMASAGRHRTRLLRSLSLLLELLAAL